MRYSRCFVLLCLLFVSVTYGQSIGPNYVPAIITLLFDDECIEQIVEGDVVLDKLNENCESSGPVSQRDINGGQYAAYYELIHAEQGLLHVDLINQFPMSFDPYVFLRKGRGRSGEVIAEDDNGHRDFKSASIRIEDLAPGAYTVEVTSYNSNTIGAYNLSVYGNKVSAKATGKSNDTGIRRSGKVDSEYGNDDNCATYDLTGKQDCSVGKDNDYLSGIGTPIDGMPSNSDNNRDGRAGFSFLKVGQNGEPLEYGASSWSCVKDNVTGLLWEVKTDNTPADLFDKDYSHSWYTSDTSNNAGSAGMPNGGTCHTGVRCDTEGYATAVNALGLCGYNDWRVPEVNELLGLMDFNSSPALSSTFFPRHGNYSGLWTASPVSEEGFGAPDAWAVQRFFGSVLSAFRSDTNKGLMLVRSEGQ